MKKPRKTKADRPGEFELIERHFAPLAAEGAFGFKDDAALLKPAPGKALVVTQDALAAGVHFFADDPPDLIARKALRVNLSDLAAKGARPVAFSLALGLEAGWTEEWVAAFAEGLKADCQHYDVVLTGGDTFRAPGATVLSVTAWGEIEPDRYRARIGAGEGDRLFVTGTIGDGAVGLLARQGKLKGLSDADVDALIGSYLLPDPPVAFAPVIAEFATAAMDISDGLVGDAAKLATASGVDFDIAANSVPLSAPVRSAMALGQQYFDTALTGGDDYQILFTVAESRVAEFLQKAHSTSTAVAELGVARKGSGAVTVTGPSGQAMRFGHASWDHF